MNLRMLYLYQAWRRWIALWSTLERFARQAAENSLGIVSASSFLHPMIKNVLLCQVSGIQYSQYRVKLCDRPTICSDEFSQFHREGFILSLTLEDGSIGYGEVAPLNSNVENLMDVEGQLQLVLHLMNEAKFSYMLPLLNGSISSWIWSELGITASSIFPSVRCGLEMALLNAMAVLHWRSHTLLENLFKKGSVLLNLKLVVE